MKTLINDPAAVVAELARGLAAVVPHSAAFGRAIIMPNLVPPVVTGAQAAAYRDRILAALHGAG